MKNQSIYQVGYLRLPQPISGRSGQQGFIQAALLFGIALMTAILGGFALANRNPTSQTDIEQAKVNASVILKQASDLRDGVSRYATDFGSSAVGSTMNFTTNTGVGLFDPSARYASPQIMPTTAFAAAPTIVAASGTSTNTAGHWTLNKLVRAKGLGSASSDDPAVVLPNIRLDVCRRINNLLYGTAITATPPTSGEPAADFSTTPAAVDLETNGAAAITGWPEGCVATSDTTPEYVYFKVVQEN